MFNRLLSASPDSCSVPVWQPKHPCPRRAHACALQVGDGVFEVLSTSGDTHLGGDDFDKRIVDWLAADFQKNEGIDLRKDRQVRNVPIAVTGTSLLAQLVFANSSVFNTFMGDSTCFAGP